MSRPHFAASKTADRSKPEKEGVSKRLGSSFPVNQRIRLLRLGGTRLI